ncbi:helix-turn-helix domain-containing protein [Streptomyces echinatus]|uniref:helix-turn-helix domain-containing protein n=1 Tax=Streptomyces echinatus TaxID=67293 RepID=UPI0037BDD545
MSTTETVSGPADTPADPITSAGPRLRRIPKGRRLTGEDAKAFTADVIKAYETKPISIICDETGRSYGAIHRLLTTNGVRMRPRGGRRTTPAGSTDAS